MKQIITWLQSVKKPMIWTCAVLLTCFAVSIGSVGYAGPTKSTIAKNAGTVEFQQNDLKKQCLAATITAINLEINRYQRWIDFRTQQGDQNAVGALQETLAVLKEDLKKYTDMDPADYPLPEKVETVGWVGDNPAKDSILYIDGMSKNGPWYHLAGILGDNYAALLPNARYSVAFYPVYQRNYWNMNSAYIYVADYSEQVQGKRMMGEVFMRQYAFPLDDKTKCDNYKIYLLKDLLPGSKGEQLLNSKKSTFDVTLSEEQLKKYAYIEFVSSYGNKTLKISELKSNPLEIILQPEVFIKKPAIYLYPVQKSQIVVTHSFKGKIVSTYPEYSGNWNVVAEPDGHLFNLKDSRTYEYLFWDGLYSFPAEHYQYQSGFYVKREEYVAFLQNKLAHIGLTEREINDFIVYWLPVMNNHNNCFVHFRINDNIGGSSVLETKPAAETVIRVFMEFSGLDHMNSVHRLPEQNLPAFTRKGFTLVEWGGVEIGSNKIE
ncbi:MAG: hypothetical protein H6Q66_593 [Firmicutes bacterium]|nr:hypothetical protein [Bacillota bacterium]